ncbi:magnesium transporter [Phenylobacterium sp.]|uniref:magnesium transporter n=1 Tax=Phenylobacterium sp. TaxID=1871053 RepID=UPI0011F7515A|nr:magnesium transporter [Phenylobacterium sp.]THD63516.1 MAG: magnesium transporter [Phenylobacterium sp.]
MSRETDDLLLKEPPETDEDLEDLALEENYELNPAYVPMVVDALDRGDSERLRELLGALHPADVADLMGFLSAADREELVPHLQPDLLGEVLADLDTEIREEILEHVSSAVLAQALGEMESDDAAGVVDDLDAGKRAQVLAAMPDVERAAIETTLAYEDETAGRLMQREVVAAPQFWTVGHTIDHLRRERGDLPELFFDVYVVDPAYKPVGACPVSHLLRSPRDTPLAQIMEQVTEIPVDMDQEEVAYIFNKYRLISAPVTEPGGRLVGQITVDDIVGVIQEETEEDILALAGVSDAGRDADFAGIVRSRLPWLVINLVTEAVAAAVVGAFQGEIAKLTALAVLMPIVSSLGGNAGTQTLTVAVRAIASRELNAANARRVIIRELLVGLFEGASMGALLGVATWIFWHDLRLALVVFLAVLSNFFVAALGGILAPIVLERYGRDPAVSSVVVVTFMTDFFGFLALLGIAALILL